MVVDITSLGDALAGATFTRGRVLEPVQVRQAQFARVHGPGTRGVVVQVRGGEVVVFLPLQPVLTVLGLVRGGDPGHARRRGVELIGRLVLRLLFRQVVRTGRRVIVRPVTRGRRVQVVIRVTITGVDRGGGGEGGGGDGKQRELHSVVVWLEKREGKERPFVRFSGSMRR